MHVRLEEVNVVVLFQRSAVTAKIGIIGEKSGWRGEFAGKLVKVLVRGPGKSFGKAYGMRRICKNHVATRFAVGKNREVGSGKAVDRVDV